MTFLKNFEFFSFFYNKNLIFYKKNKNIIQKTFNLYSFTRYLNYYFSTNLMIHFFFVCSTQPSYSTNYWIYWVIKSSYFFQYKPQIFSTHFHFNPIFYLLISITPLLFHFLNFIIFLFLLWVFNDSYIVKLLLKSKILRRQPELKSLKNILKKQKNTSLKSIKPIIWDWKLYIHVMYQMNIWIYCTRTRIHSVIHYNSIVWNILNVMVWPIRLSYIKICLF